MQDQTRRSFISKLSTATPAVIVGAGTAPVFADAPPARRDVTPGKPGAPFSRAVSYNGIVYVAGVVGRAPGADDLSAVSFDAQCRQAMENLKASIEASGSSMRKVMKCTCFLTDVADFPTFNRIFRSSFPTDPPARSTVVVKELVVPGARIEIDCVTCLDG